MELLVKKKEKKIGRSNGIDGFPKEPSKTRFMMVFGEGIEKINSMTVPEL